ncbi:MAG TPA: GTPase Era [Anaerolineales bacterium]
MAEYRSGFIAVIGRPNVGKSTLINAILQQKVAAVSPRPQTTRRRQLGILTRENAQLVFVDTPGVHLARHKLGEFMNEEVDAALTGADAILFIVELSTEPTDDDLRIAEMIAALGHRPPVVFAGNKQDLLAPAAAKASMARYAALIPPPHQSVLISATRWEGLAELLDTLAESVPPGGPVFDEDQVTDLYERDLAADLIRQACLLKLRDEVPHELGVRIDEYKERDNGVDYVRASLLVERDSQKAIVIGEAGRMLKEIGTEARREIESMTGRRAYLELHVKVEKGWRNKETVLEQLGYKSRR